MPLCNDSRISAPLGLSMFGLKRAAAGRFSVMMA